MLSRWTASTLFAFALAGVLSAAPARATEFHFHGLLDVVMAERGRAYDLNMLTRKDSPFDAYGLRLFADAQVNPRLQVFTQVVFRDAAPPYADGAYLMFTPSPTHDLHVLAGKIPWAIGTYGPRTYSDHNPLIGAPLLYQYHSSLVFYEAVPTTDLLLNAAGTGQFGVNYYGYAEGVGMPIVDDSYWDVGATIAGSARPLEYTLGLNAGTPGWGSTSGDENSGKSVLGRVGLLPLPGLRLGVSGAIGPYLHDKLSPSLPPGKTGVDYDQKLVMGDFEWLVGHAELRAEGARNIWETPYVGNLESTSGYAELKYSIPVGAFLAGRWDVLQHGDVTASDGTRHSWDWNVRRIEAGLGYRFDRGTVGKLVYQRTELERATWRDRRFQMVAAQLSVAF